jgi:hypothetical protein
MSVMHIEGGPEDRCLLWAVCGTACGEGDDSGVSGPSNVRMLLGDDPR